MMASRAKVVASRRWKDVSTTKIPVLLLPVLFAINTVQAQSPLSPEEARRPRYRGYDAATKTARWECTKEQKRNGRHQGWPCSEEGASASISVLLASGVREGITSRAYFAASAKPVSDRDFSEYDCHACAPAIGAAVFAWREQCWVLEVWSIQDEADNLGTIDPDDKSNENPALRAAATFRFLARSADKRPREYFDIEVISRGAGRQDYAHPIKSENWTEIYRFRDGEHRLLSHKDRAVGKRPQ